MAFWGVEVKPGKPYIHHYSGDQGRLRLSQATLSTGSSTKKSILQCSVGDKRPIYLCSLLPEKLETCPLNLEFEEDEEVTFSVVGPHTIHLSGFFFGEQEDEDEGESDDFEGQIIESDSEADDSMDYDTYDEDEDDSLDEDDDMYPSSPLRKSGVKIEEIVDDENPSNENGVSKQSKKKSQTSKSSNSGSSEKQIVVKSSTGIRVLESEDEDGFPISSPGAEQDVNKDTSDAHVKSLKRKIAAVEQDGESSKREDQPGDSSEKINKAFPVNETKQKKKNKKKKVSQKEEKGNETDSKTGISKGANPGDLEQNVDREKETEKKKKKKKKLENATNSEQTATDRSAVKVEEKAEAKPFQVRTFPNGLVIEELAMGKPDGKKAAPGKKVSVRYIGKLKKNGKIFDSNIGRAPFKFRLGIGEVIKGWDVGVNGMRVGDKRRLTIPPAMGYGARGAGRDIPPNSWLVFDVELVDVN